MFEMWSAPEVCLYSGPATDLLGHPIRLPAESPGDSDKIIEFFLSRREAGTGFRWAVVRVETESFVGAIGFNSLAEACEIAYHMDPRYWGNAFMLEACRAAIDWALNDFGASEIEAFIDPDNSRSIRLAERLGMTCHGVSEGENLRYSTGGG
jgi:ribosomal-protein-alanine N-acetyltransferase